MELYTLLREFLRCSIWRLFLVVTITITLSSYNQADRNDLENFDYFDHVPGEPLTPKDFQNAEELLVLAPPIGFIDPIELAGLYEGDIVLPNNLKCPNSYCEDGKNAIIQEKEKWPGGVIPYFISAQFNSLERSIIARAFLEYHRHTCITFQPRTKEPDYINIKKGKGCSSHVGRTGGAQPVTLGDGCVYPGVAVHELMHAVGFWHEQSRWDRDDYVRVYFNNIAQGMAFNFQKYKWTDIQNLSVSYDTGSVMHYGPYAFARDRRRPSISPKQPNKKMGQREGFSPSDILKINRLYRCDEQGNDTITTTTETTILPGDDNVPTPRCSDSHVHCGRWSARGECQRNSAWMLVNCRLSCNYCDEPCHDLNKYCVQWSLQGECHSNSHYMEAYCAKSCGKCAVVDPI